VESASKDAVVERLGEAATDRSRMFGSERAQTLAKERAGVVAGGYTNGVKLGDMPVLGQEFLGFAGAEDVKLVAQGVGGEDESKRKANNAVGEAVAALEVQREVAAVENALSTFSLNVTDVSFRLAGASLEQGQVPGPGAVRVEEFVNAFSYRDPEPAPGMPLGFVWERGRYPFAQQRDVLRLGVRTRAQGREEGRPLNLVLAVDNSGSMERADRVATVREALRVLGGQLKPADTLSVVTFARTPRLWMDGLTGNRVGDLAAQFGSIPPEGGTHLESALRLGYETALRHYRADGVNRVVLLTDGAANLGEVRAEALRELVAENRSRGVALDCFGVGFDGYHDELLEALSRNGDGRYGFVNTPEEAATGFANQLAGALQVAAEDVKVQVEFNPERVNQWRQIGYARHQLTAEQFRDNTVDAAEIGAAESGNALYVVEVRPGGRGPIATVRARYREPSTREYQEHAWEVPYDGPAVALERASPALRLATTAAAFGEMLSGSPYATEVTGDGLLALLGNVPEVFRPDPRPQQLGQMIQQAQSVLGR
jgi:Mg-chelatase subunit ChlD